MGLRFRKSIRLGSGARLNLSKRGVGLSLGGKGFTHSIGPSGRRTTISAPGTGLSYTAHHKSGRSRGGGIGSTILGLVILAIFLVWLLG